MLTDYKVRPEPDGYSIIITDDVFGQDELFVPGFNLITLFASVIIVCERHREDCCCDLLKLLFIVAVDPLKIDDIIAVNVQYNEAYAKYKDRIAAKIASWR